MTKTFEFFLPFRYIAALLEETSPRYLKIDRHFLSSQQ
jgi:hypothetical protein